MIKLVKDKSKAQGRSLNNYIEFLMYKDVGDIPNAETEKAIEEVRSGSGEKIDGLEEWLESI